jgi:alpha-beta hydrolase superfamily lysophospholipase
MGPGGAGAVVDDLHELRATAVSSSKSGAPVFLFGHSMGALIALSYLTRNSDGLAGSVLCGFPAGIDDAASLGPILESFAGDKRDEHAHDALSGFNAPFEPARTPYDWLSRDAAEVDRYIADPMCGDGNPLTYGYLIDLFGMVGAARDQLTAITCPVFVIAGNQDPAAAMGAHATTLADALKAAGVTVDVALYDEARHELLNETNRDQVTADIIDWLQLRGRSR